MRLFLKTLAGGTLLALSACRTVPEAPPKIVADVQWCASADAAGDGTVEVLLRNATGRAVEFVRAELDGTELPATAPAVAKALKAFAFEGLGSGARRRMDVSPPVAGARWWQFYPSPRVAAGGATVFQLNFAGASRPCALKLTTRDGAAVSVKVPRCAAPRRRIEFLAFSGDGRTLLLRHSKGAPPNRLPVNGRATDFRVLGAASESRPGAVVADLPDAVREGGPVLVELGFPDGARRFAFARAMLGVCTVAPSGWGDDFQPLPPAERAAYGFDADMRVWRLPYDIACDDTRARSPGASARAVVAARQERLAKFPDGLCGVDFCTALYPSVWNIYSQMADAVIAKPYKLHWGVNLSRFPDEEDAFLGQVVRDVAPRPVLWVPERYRKLRELDGAEYSVLAWCAMLRGVRGVRVHHWLNDPKDPFADNPGLADAVKGFNADFGRLRPRLGRLLPAGESEDRAARVAVLEGWSGDDGVLMLVRNLRYDTGIDPQTKRRTRPFAVSPIRDYALSYRLPKWLTPDAATDALSGERLEGAASNGVFKVTVPELGSHRLIWIGNAKKGVGQ